MSVIKRFKNWLGGLLVDVGSVERFNAESVERLIARVERLHLEPGDGIVITTERLLSDKHVADIKQYLQAYLDKVTGQKHPILVMDRGMGMKVVSGNSVPVPAPPRPPQPDDVPFMKP